ncbi:hypothetical protein EVAR_75865_1 [Eumeta japonica]|uniref:Uncharacterized protein n=1 Tax=Eumeta variegata TaxID=151549 RepID=A0A4C1TE16_EUMVA|nr:hypothetical protein EVAR_75865_1 [Eumeta japonica]
MSHSARARLAIDREIVIVSLTSVVSTTRRAPRTSVKDLWSETLNITINKVKGLQESIRQLPVPHDRFPPQLAQILTYNLAQS